MKSSRPMLAAVALIATAQALLSPVARASAERHCVARLLSTTSVESPKIVACFDTFTAAASFATDGRVQLDPNADRLAQVAQLDEALSAVQLPPTAPPGSSGLGDSALNATNGGEVVAGIDFADWHYEGNSLWWTAPSGCTGASWAAASMPSGWNDIVSSARGYSGCTTYLHYQHINYGGNVAFCTCYFIGSTMNDQTSSEEFYSS